MINCNGPVTNSVFARLRAPSLIRALDGARRAAFFGGVF